MTELENLLVRTSNVNLNHKPQFRATLYENEDWMTAVMMGTNRPPVEILLAIAVWMEGRGIGSVQQSLLLSVVYLEAAPR